MKTNNNISILIIDDEINIRKALRRSLFEDYDIAEAKSFEEALEILKTDYEPDIIIADYLIPGGMNGIDFFVKIKNQLPHIKKIIMTGQQDNNIAFQAINKGQVHHFIQKPWNTDELKITLKQMSEIQKLETHNHIMALELKYANKTLEQKNLELKKHKQLLKQSLDERTKELLETVRQLESLNKKLKQQATRDGLTGLYNHVNIKNRLKEEISRARRYESPLSIIFCDIDHFKLYNDRLGHDVGDQVLLGVATFLLNGSDIVSPSRQSDIIGRYGGEEFVIILPETDKQGAKIRAERLRKGLNLLDVPGAKEQPLGFLSMSMGVATFPEDADNAENLLKLADQALYKAKNNGRNKVSLV